MAAMYVKLNPCGGHTRGWWSMRADFCGRPSGHDGRCRRLPLPDDSLALLIGGDTGEPVISGRLRRVR